MSEQIIPMRVMWNRHLCRTQGHTFYAGVYDMRQSLKLTLRYGYPVRIGSRVCSRCGMHEAVAAHYPPAEQEAS